MIERFEGAGRANLVDALKRQEFVGSDTALAEDFVLAGTLVEYHKGDRLIVENGADNDLFLLVAGSVAVVVKGSEVATRTAGHHVGEMAAIEPSQPRAASVIAHDTVVALRISNAEFLRLGGVYPKIWQPLARELARRLYQRNKLIPQPNASPKMFVISSAEALSVAREIQSALQRDVLSTVWTDGVFFAGGYSLEALEKAVSESDFAIAIAQADDIVETRGVRYPTLRDNVLFELGLFMGKLTRFRTILVHPRVKELKLPSDLQGLTALSYEPGPPEELSARVAPACNAIRKTVTSLGVRTLTS